MIEYKSREVFKQLIYIITISMAVIGVLFIPQIIFSKVKLSKTIEQNQSIEIAKTGLVSEESLVASKKITSRSSSDVRRTLDKKEESELGKEENAEANKVEKAVEKSEANKAEEKSEASKTEEKSTEAESKSKEKKESKKKNKKDSKSEETKIETKSSKKANAENKESKKVETKKVAKSDVDKEQNKEEKKKDEEKEKSKESKSDTKKEEKESKLVDDNKKTAEAKQENKSSEKDTEKTTEKEDSSEKETTTKKENKKSTTKTVPISKVTISKTMNLTKRTGLARKDFIKLMSGVKADTSGFFEKNAGKIYDLCQKYSINEIFFCGLISAESGWNIASNHRRTHNYISLMRNGKLISYGSVNEGLEVAAQKLHYNYLTPGGKFYHGKTLAGVKTCFCPSSSWVGLVYGRMRQIL